MKDNTIKTPMERFWALLKPDKKEIRNVYIYSIFNGLVTLSLPIGIQAIINLIQGGQINTSWFILVLFVIGGIAFSGYLQISQLKITENLQQKIFSRAAFEFAYRIPKIKMEAIYKQYAPELMNRFFDVISVQKGLSKILIDFSMASIQVLFGLVLLSLYHPFFIFFSMILIFLLFIIFRYTAKKGLMTSLRESKHKYTVANWLQEVARTHMTIKLAGKTDLPVQRVDKATGEYINARDDHFKILMQQYFLMVGFKVIIGAGLLVVGSILVMEQQMNIGQFVASEIIILLVLSSVEKLILSLETIYDVLTSLEKIGQVTDMELESNEGMLINNEDKEGYEVEISNLSFSYPFTRNTIFEDLSLKVKAGEKILITGKNDTGKSTLLSILTGLYPSQKGFVAYDGIPLGNLDIENLRSNIGDCLMEELLFEGTLLENINIGREKATFENVKWAIDNLGLGDFVKNLPNGYNTVIDLQGKQFSKGIIDKLLLARSIADKPKVLLIKDSFGSFLPERKQAIIDFLTEQPWTLFIASQDKYIAGKVDRIVEIENKTLTIKK
ncbi:MAG: ATP-binding cassette domain-containing protein [Flavobacteriales bacterium]|jgi:ABC-type bacteriocin/lantibiotic exporter with double-glycine peptidase domain|tara:strand:+ start:1755 stop:3422 length:1668 start_codon:yes stop_codon:yes gene_type:complete